MSIGQVNVFHQLASMAQRQGARLVVAEQSSIPGLEIHFDLAFIRNSIYLI